jgi:hypothetical protein
MSRSIEVNCEEYEVKAGSIRHSRDGYVFRCTISLISEDILRGLETTARLHGTIRLVFPERPLLLERVEVKRIKAGSVRIAGHVVGS